MIVLFTVCMKIIFSRLSENETYCGHCHDTHVGFWGLHVFFSLLHVFINELFIGLQNNVQDIKHAVN